MAVVVDACVGAIKVRQLAWLWFVIYLMGGHQASKPASQPASDGGWVCCCVVTAGDLICGWLVGWLVDWLVAISRGDPPVMHAHVQADPPARHQLQGEGRQLHCPLRQERCRQVDPVPAAAAPV